MNQAALKQMEYEIAPVSTAWKKPVIRERRLNMDAGVEELVNVFVSLMAAKGFSHLRAQSMVRDEYMRRAMVICNGNQCAAAKMMGVHRNTLSRMRRPRNAS